MLNPLITALLQKGWTYSMIALRSGISENRLRSGIIGRRETVKLERVAEVEAKLDLEEIYEGEE